MKIGVKEFRDRLREITHGTELVEVTHHGRVIGTYQPWRRDPERARAAAAAVERWQAEMKAKGIDLESHLAAIGLDPWGEPLNGDDSH